MSPILAFSLLIVAALFTIVQKKKKSLNSHGLHLNGNIEERRKIVVICIYQLCLERQICGLQYEPWFQRSHLTSKTQNLRCFNEEMKAYVWINKEMG